MSAQGPPGGSGPPPPASWDGPHQTSSPRSRFPPVDQDRGPRLRQSPAPLPAPRGRCLETEWIEDDPAPGRIGLVAPSRGSHLPGGERKPPRPRGWAAQLGAQGQRRPQRHQGTERAGLMRSGDRGGLGAACGSLADSPGGGQGVGRAPMRVPRFLARRIRAGLGSLSVTPGKRAGGFGWSSTAHRPNWLVGNPSGEPPVCQFFPPVRPSSWSEQPRTPGGTMALEKDPPIRDPPPPDAGPGSSRPPAGSSSTRLRPGRLALRLRPPSWRASPPLGRLRPGGGSSRCAPTWDGGWSGHRQRGPG